jgi:DNA-binding response OmpR family regulator
MSNLPQNHVLVIEDDSDLAKALAAHLKSQGFEAMTALTGREGMRLFREEAPDLILLDTTLPDEDSLMLCRRIRRESEIPILFIGECREEQECVEGLQSGADDYLGKPLRLRELIARMRAVQRRAGAPLPSSAPTGDGASIGPEKVLTVGDLRLRLTSCSVEIKERVETLTPNEFRLLAILMGAPGEVFTREDLRERVWSKDYHKKIEHSLHLVEVHIANLRSKIEEDAHHPKRLVTVRSRGYKLLLPEAASSS